VDKPTSPIRTWHGLLMTTVIPHPAARPPDPEPHGPLRLVPSARVLWRGADCVQVELGDRAIVLEGVRPTDVAALTGRPVDPAVTARVHRVVRALRHDGLVRPRRRPNQRWTDSQSEALLALELTALANRDDDAAALLAGRRAAQVEVVGAARLGAAVAAALGAAGVGRVNYLADGEVTVRDVLPGGLTPADEGTRLATAVALSTRRAAPATSTVGSGRPPDLVVIASGATVGRDAADYCVKHRLPHLLVAAQAHRAVVGPLVIPGRSSCAGCLDRHRTDRDDAWPYLSLQLGTPSRRGDVAESALCQLGVAIAAIQALAFLDGEHPATVDGTLESSLPDWRIRRRSWTRHPRCECDRVASRAAGPAE
jgi:bacteriocin biosynthesis cyclodehydratase domain-containing protein